MIIYFLSSQIFHLIILVMSSSKCCKSSAEQKIFIWSAKSAIFSTWETLHMLLMYKFRTQHWPQGMMSIHEEQQSNFTTCQTVYFKHWQRFPSITVSSFSSGTTVIKNWLKLIAMPPILYSSWLLLMNHSVVLPCFGHFFTVLITLTCTVYGLQKSTT